MFFITILACKFLLFCTFATDKSCLTSKHMHIAEIRTVAKSLPPLRWNTHKSLILSYSADFSVIFPENRRLDLAFPYNPGVTFAPSTKMTAWCGSLKGAKMEVNGSRGRLDRKTSKEKSVKKTSPTEKNIAGSVKPGKPSARKYVFICLAKRVWSDG